jgi:predicted ATPase
VSGASEGLLGHGAVRLFAERMWAIGTDPTERPEDLVAVAAICRRLDGNPLAIEFAAATACALGPQAVLEGLGARFALLTTGRRTAPLRHRTLRTALDCSHDLLPEAERRLLRRLGVMAGGVPLGAAEAVMATDAGPPPGRTAAGLAALAAKALVVTDDAAGAPRWRLLKTVRAYALERLAEAGEAEETARRHARFYRGLFAPAGCSPGIAPTLGSRAAFARELDNARAALDWAFSPPPRGTWRSALL